MRLPRPIGCRSAYRGVLRIGGSALRPARSGIAKWVYRHISQEVCPWNVTFAQALPEGSPFAARAMFVDKDARTLARDILAMEPSDYAAAFKDSAIKRAKLWMLKRNAAVVLGNVGTREDAPVLEAASQHGEPLVQEHAGWAIRQI